MIQRKVTFRYENIESNNIIVKIDFTFSTENSEYKDNIYSFAQNEITKYLTHRLQDVKSITLRNVSSYEKKATEDIWLKNSTKWGDLYLQRK
jgi:hypothetical protein